MNIKQTVLQVAHKRFNMLKASFQLINLAKLSTGLVIPKSYKGFSGKCAREESL